MNHTIPISKYYSVYLFPKKLSILMVGELISTNYYDKLII